MANRLLVSIADLRRAPLKIAMVGGSILATLYIGSIVVDHIRVEYRWNQIVDEAIGASAMSGNAPSLGSMCADKICVSQIAFVSKKDVLVTIRYSTRGSNMRVICTSVRGGDVFCHDFDAQPEGVYECFQNLMGDDADPFACIAPKIMK